MRTFRCGIAVAITSVIATAANPVAAQNEVTYNLRTGSLEGDALRAGRPVTIRVEGLNPLCYSHVARADAVRETPDISAILTAMSATSKTAQPAPAAVVPPPPPPVAPPAQPGIKINAAAIGAVRSAALDDLVREAGEEVNALEALRADVEDAEQVVSNPCGRDGEVMELLESWESRRHGLARGMAEMPAREAALTEALRRARDVVDGDDNQLQAAEQAVFDQYVKPVQDRAASTLPSLRKSWAALEPSLSTVDLAANTREIQLAPANDHDTKSLVVVVESTPRRAFPGVSPTAVSRTVAIPVRREARAFLSTGVLITFMEARDYGRVNRPYPIKNTEGAVVGYADSTYSTFASQNQSAYDYFSPAVQFNTGLGRLTGWFEDGTGVALMASFGLAARITNGATRAEPFLGVSTSVADRFVLTAGAHWTREEVLRITLPGESAEDVESRKVPTSITDQDAIGTQGRRSAFLSISVKP
jgi:hypothetical protein